VKAGTFEYTFMHCEDEN